MLLNDPGIVSVSISRGDALNLHVGARPHRPPLATVAAVLVAHDCAPIGAVHKTVAIRKRSKGIVQRPIVTRADDVAEALKKGDAEIAVAGPFREVWDRFDSWPLFTEPFCLAVNKEHPFAKRNTIEPEDLANERLLWRTYCEHATEFEDFLKSRKLHTVISHKVDCENDLLVLLEANLGIGVLPSSAPRSENIKLVTINGLELRRTVCLYGVAGRQRSPATSALIKLMRASDWSI